MPKFAPDDVEAAARRSRVFVPEPGSLFDLPPGPPAPVDRPPLPTVAAGVKAATAGNANVVAACRDAMVAKSKAAAVRGVNGEVSGDDATLWIRAHAPQLDPRVLGGVFRSAGWEFVRWGQSALPGRHARGLRVWRWAGR
jgi:hypothetical protein